MFHGRDGAQMHVLCLGCLSWNDHSSRVCISEEGDGAFQAGMVASGIQWWGPWVSDIQKRGKQTNSQNKSGIKSWTNIKWGQTRAGNDKRNWDFHTRYLFLPPPIRPSHSVRLSIVLCPSPSRLGHYGKVITIKHLVRITGFACETDKMIHNLFCFLMCVRPSNVQKFPAWTKNKDHVSCIPGSSTNCHRNDRNSYRESPISIEALRRQALTQICLIVAKILSRQN